MINGLLVIDKPAGMTSHDVVGKCRRIVGQKRVGHAGTLDPGATGVLLVALGTATRLMKYVSELQKSYVGEVVLGTTTTTLDNEGEVTAEFDMSSVTPSDVENAAQKFLGNIEQIPPMVSAVKIGGKRLHELARQGIEVERKPRPVTVFRIETRPTSQSNVFLVEVDCSSGTYIRTLAADIGETLGGGAHLQNLRRTAIGPFKTESAFSLEALQEDGFSHALLTPAAMVAHLDTVIVGDQVATDISYGRSLNRDNLAVTGEGPWALVDKAGTLLATYESSDDSTQLRASVVLAAG